MKLGACNIFYPTLTIVMQVNILQVDFVYSAERITETRPENNATPDQKQKPLRNLFREFLCAKNFSKDSNHWIPTRAYDQRPTYEASDSKNRLPSVSIIGSITTDGLESSASTFEDLIKHRYFFLAQRRSFKSREISEDLRPWNSEFSVKPFVVQGNPRWFLELFRLDNLFPNQPYWIGESAGFGNFFQIVPANQWPANQWPANQRPDQKQSEDSLIDNQNQEAQEILMAPENTAFNSWIQSVNQRLEANGHPPISISFQKIDSQVSILDILKMFSHSSALPYGGDNYHTIHDISFHYPGIVIPEEYIQHARQRAKLGIAFIEKLNQKKLPAILIELFTGQITNHIDSGTANAATKFRSRYVREIKRPKNFLGRFSSATLPNGAIGVKFSSPSLESQRELLAHTHQLTGKPSEDYAEYLRNMLSHEIRESLIAGNRFSKSTIQAFEADVLKVIEEFKQDNTEAIAKEFSSRPPFAQPEVVDRAYVNRWLAIVSAVTGTPVQLMP